MKKISEKWETLIGNPVVLRRINGWATLVWFIAAFPICLFLSESVPFLVFISVYAVVTGHLSSWQAARVEVRQQEEDEVREEREAERDEKLVEKIDEITPDSD